MGHDAQIQMIASNIKMGQKLSCGKQGEMISQLTITLEGGAKSSLMPETKATIKIVEQVPEMSLEDQLDSGLLLGDAVQANGQFVLKLSVPESFLSGIMKVLPYCEPEKGGYLSVNTLLSGAVENGIMEESMKILSMEYKAVKRLSDQDDLLRGQ